MKYLKDMIALSLRIFRDIERKHLSLVAAGLSYYFLMSLFPSLVLLTAVLAYLPLQNGTQGVTSFMAHVIPRQGMFLIEPMLATIGTHRTGLLWFGIVTTLWLVSGSVQGIIAGLDIVYDVREPRSLWINRIVAFGLTLGVGALLLLGVVVTTAGPALKGLLSTAVGLQSLWMNLFPYFQWLLAAIVTFAAVELLYLLAPNVPAAHRPTIPGAVVATATVLALSGILGFYFFHFGDLKLDLLYGVLATPIALMIWLKSGAAAILIGAEINVILQSQSSGDPRA